MKKTLDSFSTPLTERAKSPFYGSFVISWLIWNWRILFVVAFPARYNIGNQNLAEYILDKYINRWDTLYTPLLFTGGYLLVLPLIDWLIIAYTEYWKRLKLDIKNKQSKKRLYTGEEYYHLNAKFDEERDKILKIEKLLEEEKSEAHKKSVKISELASSTRQSQERINSLVQESIELRDNYNVLIQRHDVAKAFQGRWRLEYSDTSGGNLQVDEINIIGNLYKIIRNNQEIEAYQIRLMDFDPTLKKLTFVKYSNTLPKPAVLGRYHCIADLDIIDKDRYEGYENYNTKVTYTKVKNDFYLKSDPTNNFEV